MARSTRSSSRRAARRSPRRTRRHGGDRLTAAFRRYQRDLRTFQRSRSALSDLVSHD